MPSRLDFRGSKNQSRTAGRKIMAKRFSAGYAFIELESRGDGREAGPSTRDCRLTKAASRRSRRPLARDDKFNLCLLRRS